MRASELRAQARESLKEKWGRAAILTLIYLIASFIISYLAQETETVGAIISLVISPIISFGILASYIKLSRNEETSLMGFLDDGFKNFGKIWGVAINSFFRLILPVLLIFISGVFSIVNNFVANSGASSASSIVSILSLLCTVVGLVWFTIRSFSLSLTSLILFDEPSLSSSEIVKKSMSLMQGNKLRYFWLSLSFLGWSMLAILSLGIGTLWFMPYMQIAVIKFYEDLANPGSVVTTATAEEVEAEN